MTINGVNISAYGARQHRVEIGHQSINFSNEWPAGSTLPFMGVSQPGFKELTVTLVIKDTTRTALIAKRSQILKLLTGPATLVLDGYSNYFYGVLKSHKETEQNQKRWHNMELTFECYEYGADVAYSGTSSLSVTNPGTAVSPCRVTITPAADASSITLTGLCRDPISGDDQEVTIEDVESGKAIILDGITGLITQENDLREVDMWALPSLEPGDSTITCDNASMAIAVTVRPVYL